MRKLGGAVAARNAHNVQVAGSIPAPAIQLGETNSCPANRMMTMGLSLTPRAFQRFFPHASRSTLAANGALLEASGIDAGGCDVEAGGKVSDAEPEHLEAPALGRPIPGEKESVGRVSVRFIGYRVRPLDPDNFAGSVKDCLDFLRHAGLIPGDEPWRIKLETEQEKVASFKEERTEIVLTWPCP